MTSVSYDRRGNAELESVVENDDLVLIKRFLTFGTTSEARKRANFMQMLREL